MERLITATTLLALAATPVAAQSLRGSQASVNRQHRVAVQHDYSFLTSATQVRRMTTNGYLVSLPGNANYELHGVSYPVARPAVKTFIERLSQQYRSACGEKLVVTSLTRPTSKQPRNASDESVHPAGMAADLRISNSSRCRAWIERVLLSLEGKGVLEATREHSPAHYHVAVFPNPYLAYVGQLRRTVLAAADPAPADGPSAADPAVAAAAEPAVLDYRVNRGDTLWDIARRHGTSIAEIKSLNGLSTSRIKAGQRLKVPSHSAS